MAEELVLGNETAVHKAAIWIQVEVHEIHPATGEYSGRPVHKDKLTLEISGSDKFICIRKLNEALQEFKKLCQTA
jgi:hypothetical protein